MSDPASLSRRIAELTGHPAPRPLEILTDTTEFMSIWRGHVLRLGERHYLVLGDMREGRFGVDDNPKFWVKKAIELESGRERVLKLVFHEEFRIRVGLLSIRCRRDPRKEGEVLDLVRGDPRFMQGETVEDDHGNPVRIVDFIRGKSLYDVIREDRGDHRTYQRERLPGILARVTESIRAIADLHAKGYHHGDIRNDHLLVEAGTGALRWIDFDLRQDVSDFDVWSLGNVLLLVIGMGEHTLAAAAAGGVGAPEEGAILTAEDASAFFAHRVMNLRKLFPWIPRELNEILMHFSWGTDRFYESVEEILADLDPVVESLLAAGAGR